MTDEKAYLRIRNFLGILGCLLPTLCVGGAALSPNTIYPDWWTSISITYYSSPVLIAVLTSVGFMLITYRGYNTWDTIVNSTAGVCALCVVCFPTEASWLDMSTEVGLFWLPIRVTRLVHYSTAFILFLLLAINSICLFARGRNKKKNMIYKVCGYVILLFLLIFGINQVFIGNKGMVIVYESIMLVAFGVSWIVKGHMLDKYLE